MRLTAHLLVALPAFADAADIPPLFRRNVHARADNITYTFGPSYTTTSNAFSTPSPISTPGSLPLTTDSASTDASVSFISTPSTESESDTASVTSVSSESIASSAPTSLEPQITPDPATVSIETYSTIPGITENTLLTTTDEDGQNTVVPVLFGLPCLIFCDHIGPGGGPGALVLHGIGPGPGAFILPPLPGITPAPATILINDGVPTPVNSQKPDEEEPDEEEPTKTDEPTKTTEETSASESTTTSTVTSGCPTTTIGCDDSVECGGGLDQVCSADTNKGCKCEMIATAGEAHVGEGPTFVSDDASETSLASMLYEELYVNGVISGLPALPTASSTGSESLPPALTSTSTASSTSSESLPPALTSSSTFPASETPSSASVTSVISTTTAAAIVSTTLQTSTRSSTLSAPDEIICGNFGGPDVATPYCQCSTTTAGQTFFATTSIPADGQCYVYSEFPTPVTLEPTTAAPDTTAPPSPLIQTEVNGDVISYASQTVEYGEVPGGVQITITKGLGNGVTISTPVPTQTAGNIKGAGSCGDMDDACDRAFEKYEDDRVYTDYTAYTAKVESGILLVATFGTAGCSAMFECDDYGIGMSGKEIKNAVRFLKDDANQGADKCGSTYLSNTCHVTLNYCTSCESSNN